MPADPAKMMLGDRDNAKQIELINKKYHFDQPIYKQYLYYLQDLSPISIHYENPVYPSYFNLLYINNYHLILKKPYLRTSFYQKNILVSDLIYSAFPNTIILAFSSILFALIILTLPFTLSLIHNPFLVITAKYFLSPA